MAICHTNTLDDQNHDTVGFSWVGLGGFTKAMRFYHQISPEWSAQQEDTYLGHRIRAIPVD